MEKFDIEKLLSTIKRLSPALSQQIPSNIKVVLRKLPQIKAILFDIYGTLFLSGAGDVGVLKENRNANALVEALQAIHLKPCNQATIISDLFVHLINESHNNSRQKGVDFPEIDILQVMSKLLDLLFAKRWIEGPKISDDAIAQLCVEYETRVNQVYPMPDLLETIHELRQKNIPLGLISNAQFYTPLLFSAFFNKTTEEMGFHKDYTIYSYILGIAKPSNHIFKSALLNLAKTQIKPEETLFVGNDMLNDIYPAMSLGMKTCLFAGDLRSYRPRSENPVCASLVPDLTITHLSQIAGCV